MFRRTRMHLHKYRRTAKSRRQVHSRRTRKITRKRGGARLPTFKSARQYLGKYKRVYAPLTALALLSTGAVVYNRNQDELNARLFGKPKPIKSVQKLDSTEPSRKDTHTLHIPEHRPKYSLKHPDTIPEVIVETMNSPQSPDESNYLDNYSGTYKKGKLIGPLAAVIAMKKIERRRLSL